MYILDFSFWILTERCIIVLQLALSINNVTLRIFSLLHFILLIFIHTSRRVGPLFPDQGSNQGPLHWNGEF